MTPDLSDHGVEPFAAAISRAASVNKLLFTVPGMPRPKERPRKGKHGNFYTPGATAKYEEEVWVMAQSAGARQDCFKGKLLAVKIVAAAGPTREDLLHADIDNIAKAILDGLKPAFNDAYVVHLVVSKVTQPTQWVSVEVSG